MQSTVTGDVRVPVPRLLELTNLLLGAQRRKRITADKRREPIAAVAALRVRVDREPVSIVLLDDLAARYGLSAYHASYLELAMRRGLPRATRDQASGKAMTSAGVAAYAY